MLTEQEAIERAAHLNAWDAKHGQNQHGSWIAAPYINNYGGVTDYWCATFVRSA